MCDTKDDGPSPVGIALSGGGTRAAMMGVGSIRRLYELGILRRATTISSVSGGSIVNAVLAMHWVELMATDGVDLELFDRLISVPVRAICSTNLGLHVLGHKMNPVRLVKKVKSKITGELGFTPTHLGLHLAKYMPCMDIPLSQLPKPKIALKGGVPRFVFCGCDLSTGKPFYFTQQIVGHSLDPHMRVKHPSGAYPILSEELTHAIPLTQAVGASAAVPLVFEPLEIKVEMNGESYSVGIVDGAVYDNLGLDPLIGDDNVVMLEGCKKEHKVIFVNDAGAPWFLPLDRFSGKHVVRRVTRSLTIALSRGHDERVRFLDLMFKRNILYGAYWRLGDLERIYDKFSEEEIAVMRDLCFPSKQMFDPLLISRIIEFRTDLNELKPAEMRVLENAGYILAAFKFHRYVVPALKDKNIVDTSNFTAVFRFPIDNQADDIRDELKKLTEALKNSNSLFKANINLKPHHLIHKRKKKKKSKFECQFQLQQQKHHLHFRRGSASTSLPNGEEEQQAQDVFESAVRDYYNKQHELEERSEQSDDEKDQHISFADENEEDEYEEDDQSDATSDQSDENENNGYVNFPREPNHPLFRSKSSPKLPFIHHANIPAP